MSPAMQLIDCITTDIIMTVKPLAVIITILIFIAVVAVIALLFVWSRRRGLLGNGSIDKAAFDRQRMNEQMNAVHGQAHAHMSSTTSTGGSDPSGGGGGGGGGGGAW